MRLVCCVGVTGTSSVQSDCLWKELVLAAGACSAYDNICLMVTVRAIHVSDNPPHTTPGVDDLEGQICI